MKSATFILAGVTLYVLGLLGICAADGGRPSEAIGAALHYLASGTFAREGLVVAVTLVLVFLFATALAYVGTAITATRQALKAAAVLLKVTPALALTPIIVRVLPRAMDLDTRMTTGTVITGILIGFYPIFSSAVFFYEEAVDGAPGQFARTIGASRYRAHLHVYLGSLLRGALIGAQTGFPLAVIGVVVGEMIAAVDTPNIGYQIMAAISTGRTEIVIAAVLATTSLGVAAYLVGEVAGRLAKLLVGEVA